MRSLAIVASLLVLASCAGRLAPGGGDAWGEPAYDSQSYIGDGHAASQARAIAAASGIDVSGPVSVEVKIGAAPSAMVTADTNLLSLVRLEMRGDTLVVRAAEKMFSKTDLRVKITLPHLERISASGAARLAVSGLNGAQLSVAKQGDQALHLAGRVTSLDMHVNGNGNVNASALQCGNASVNLAGAGMLAIGQVRGEAFTANVRGDGALQVGGAVQSANVHVFAGGGANLVGMVAQQATLSTLGAGDISATVNQSLIAQTNGTGHITVYGNPSHRAITGKQVEVLN